jgi:hypothetical protein
MVDSMVPAKTLVSATTQASTMLLNTDLTETNATDAKAANQDKLLSTTFVPLQEEPVLVPKDTALLQTHVLNAQSDKCQTTQLLDKMVPAKMLVPVTMLTTKDSTTLPNTDSIETIATDANHVPPDKLLSTTNVLPDQLANATKE